MSSNLPGREGLGRAGGAVVATLVVLASITAGVGMTTVAADDHDDPITDLFDGEDGNETEGDDGLVSLSTAHALLDSWAATAEGLFQRARDFGDDAEATAAADDVQAFVNNHSASLETYANARVTASTELDTIAFTFQDEAGEDTRYLIADVRDGNYTNVSMVATTDRTVDERCEIAGQAAADARAELETFHEQFVSEDSDLTAAYLAGLTSEYQPDVSCSFFPF